MDSEEIKRRMHGAVTALRTELAGLRTGRASVSLLEPIHVDAYGASMALNQVASVSVPEPRMLSVQVWDKALRSAMCVATALIRSRRRRRVRICSAN
jgi:ribosome recycling factor